MSNKNISQMVSWSLECEQERKVAVVARTDCEQFEDPSEESGWNCMVTFPKKYDFTSQSRQDMQLWVGAMHRVQ